ncbi:unsaturated glucuronyl hydrolase (glycoside hydrolase family 88) [Metarhizium robertsii]|uniref:Glycoside hydrolase family 105 protein n=2 Tax=Metarhizium robertsii TaxID=568076 RepID=E9EYE6_METRA|nr:glycoside hydrolase family 105 protein [Metarhizium robertsii ARSEF 23]EFY98987.1 glycoside hydrolase family 105 protein [Metarhizium robertsii ARSEF 23]EXV05012.1 unsaturated glucuronyl hydrolase (glycoside hydrolase family 88) [Metarhizium robertsii]
MPLTAHGFSAAEIHSKIQLLINGLVNIKDDTGEFLMTLADGRVIDTKGWNDWEWTHGIGLYGIWKYYQTTGDARHLQIIEDWFRDRFAAGGTTKNINTMAALLTLAYVYDQTRNPTYLPWLDNWGEWAYRDLGRTKHGGMQHTTYLEDNDQQLWDDTLMMTVLPLAKIGLVLDRPHYVAEAKRQFLLHIQYLFDAKTGLFFHGWTFRDGGHHFASARWARGNSWLTIGIPEFIELLDLGQSDGPLCSHLQATLAAQCEALKTLQSPNGLWRTLLDVSEKDGSYGESSATAGFAFGLLKGQRKRYIQGEYQHAAFKAVRGVLENISPDGQLQNTSFGTGMGSDLEFYKKIPITPMPYGQAMAILALVELLNIFI